MLEPRNLMFGGVLLILLGGSQWLASTSQKESVPIEPETHDADYFVENFTNTNMDVTGRPFRRLRASKMLHFPDDDSTQLTDPYLTLYEDNVPLWKIQSERGWVSGDGELLLLKGRVVIDRIKTEELRPLNIVTRNLRLQPEQNYAETDEVVTVTSEGSRLKSRGAQAWFSEPVKFKFLSDVRGQYAVK